MKKIMISVSAMAVMSFAVATQANAQTIGFSPEVGVNFSNVVGDQSDNNESKAGLKVGLNAHVPLTENLYLSPGLHYSQKGFKADGILPNTEFRFNPGYLEVPVNLMYRANTGAGAFFITAGPYVGFGIGGNKTINEKETSKVDWGKDKFETNPMDVGVNVGVGYELPIGLYVRAQYGRGLTSLSNDENISQYNQNIQLSLGYNLWSWMR